MNRTPPNAWYIRNRSASQQLTVFAADSVTARAIAHELIGGVRGNRNKSCLRAVRAVQVEGYGAAEHIEPTTGEPTK